MIKVPEGKVVTICEDDRYMDSVGMIVDAMRGKIKRDWFVPHAYYCLPLVIGNQYGFSIRSLWDFRATWNGGNSPGDVILQMGAEGDVGGRQLVFSHFGMGIVTVQNRFTFRTPDGINLMTISPPNHWIDGVHHMTGVVETDNLRRDFTFNIKLTRPNHTVHIEKGALLGCVMPVPRRFVDGFELAMGEDIFEPAEIAEERKAMKDFAKERQDLDIHKPGGNGRRYFEGEDVYGNKFMDHQKRILRDC